MTDQSHDKVLPAPTEDELFEKCKHIATSKCILTEVEKRMAASGQSLDLPYKKLLWMALHSRWKSPCVNIGVFGPPAVGKTTMVDEVLKFVPPEAVEITTTLTPRALGHDDTSYKNRFLYVQEYAGLDGPSGNEQLRALIWDGKLIHKGVNKGKSGGHESQRTYKEGPTGLIMTTTQGAIHSENQSRMLCLHVEGTPERVAAILAAQGERAANPWKVVDVNYDDFHAFDQWIALRPKDVVIPYMPILSGLLLKTNAQMTRYARIIEQMVATSAIVHQFNRQTDNGYIVATVEDYANIYPLLKDVLEVGLGESVPNDMKAAIQAATSIKDHRAEAKHGVRPKWVGEKLGVGSVAVSRIFKIAEDAGYVRNVNPYGKKLDRFILGDALPEPTKVLPTPEELEEAIKAKHAA